MLDLNVSILSWIDITNKRLIQAANDQVADFQATF